MSDAAAAPTAVRPIWADLVGQEPTVTTLSQAVADPAAMTHAWLFTGLAAAMLALFTGWAASVVFRRD